jgi:hypothetical protein
MTTSPASVVPSTDIDSLAAATTLVPRPISATWHRETRGSNRVAGVPGPKDYLLVAVLRYADKETAEVVSAAAGLERPRAGETEIRDWFPDAMKQRAIKNERGTLVIRGERLSAERFLRSPLLNGSLVRIPDSNDFVLMLYTM